MGKSDPCLASASSPLATNRNPLTVGTVTGANNTAINSARTFYGCGPWFTTWVVIQGIVTVTIPWIPWVFLLIRRSSFVPG